MKPFLLLSALLILPALAFSQGSSAERQPTRDAIDYPVTSRMPPNRWPHIAHQVVSCTAVETSTHLSFRSVERRMTYGDACRSALAIVGERCASHFGGTFTLEPAAYLACEGGGFYTDSGANYTCRISCGPALR